MTYEQAATGTLPVVTVKGAGVPRLSTGLALHGEYQGSGFTAPKYIARRGDGQVVQLSRLLYLVASSIDGVRDAETIAHWVSARFGRELSADNVRYLIEEKLDPLGVTVPEGQEEDEVVAPRSDLLLALKGHRVIFDERRVAGIARALSWLHRPAVVVSVLAGMAALDVWLFAFFGAITPSWRSSTSRCCCWSSSSSPWPRSSSTSSGTPPPAATAAPGPAASAAGCS